MQAHPNPPGGECRLGETHCDRCGAPRPPFDDEGLFNAGAGTGVQWTLDQLHAELRAIRDEEGAI